MRTVAVGFSAFLVIAALGLWYVLVEADDTDPVVPVTEEGFVELAHARGVDTENAQVWVYGGPVAFSDWRTAAVKTFNDVGWHTGPAPEHRVAAFELHASAPDQSVCVSYYDLKASAREIEATRRQVAVVAPDALASEDAFASPLIFVWAGECP